MRTQAPALLPIFRSALQARLLLHVLTAPRPMTAADLSRELAEPQPTVSREVARLLTAGLLRGERVGRAVRLSAAEDNPATEPLRQLLIVTFGPGPLIERALSGIDGIDAVYLHGSWAARFRGEVGGPPGDIDVLVVGAPARAEVDAALQSVEEALSHQVNATYVSADRWESAEQPFLRHVRERPLVQLHPEGERWRDGNKAGPPSTI
jgi:DNA-binding transcriptional ArsR family regulator